MQCSEETLASFFYNVSSLSFLLLLFIYYSSISLFKFFHFIGSYPLIQRTQSEYDYSLYSDEDGEEEEEEVCTEKDHLVADIIHGGESLVFLHNNAVHQSQQIHVQEFIEQEDDKVVEDHQEYQSFESSQYSALDSSPCSESEHEGDHDDDELEEEEEEIPPTDSDSAYNSVPNHDGATTPVPSSGFGENDQNCYVAETVLHQETEIKKEEKFFTGDGNYVILTRTQVDSSRKIQVEEKDIIDEEIYGDSCTNGSTSKSSSEWRSSINCRDSGTEDPFSSSSRRSCPKWESYTVFQKYDEEMMSLDKVSAQKLHETESLRSIQARPRSISERIIHKFSTVNKQPSSIRHNPYHELEAAYVAQICLTWEALNWNYKNFQRKRASKRDFDPGCPAHIAQQFQQFQVLLQRYIENEPYEQGRRPEVYARMRLLAPKLLLVPEYRDSEDDQLKDEGFASRITSPAFIIIMEEGIRTFMNFLKADKEKACQILRSFFGRTRKRRASVDPTLLQLMKKVNKKKKTKVKDLRRSMKCIRRRKLTADEEVEILMALIDLKVVSRVLRMNDISEEQLHWCEEKMSKVSVMEGKLQRDSSPLFFPAH